MCYTLSMSQASLCELFDTKTGRRVTVDVAEGASFEDRVMAIALASARLYESIDSGFVLLAAAYENAVRGGDGHVDLDEIVAFATLPDWVVPPSWASARAAYLKQSSAEGLH